MPCRPVQFQRICFHSIATQGGTERSGFTGSLLLDKQRYRKEIAHGVFHMEPSISQPLDPNLYFHQEQWIQEQELLKKRLVLKDDFSWKIHPVLPSNGESGGENILRYIGGVDLSFSKDDSSIACGALVVVDLDTLCVVYEDFDIVHLTMPYVPGFLAFRECPVLLGLLEKMKRAFHPFYPQLLMVDGNGILHPRGFGLASHLGVLSDLPSIGIGKNLHHVDGLTHEQVRRHLPKNTNKDGDAIPLTGKSGQTWGVAFRYNEQSSKPIFISVGHRISLETSIAIVRMCCKYRVPEPIRQADIRSKEYLQKKHRYQNSLKLYPQICGLGTQCLNDLVYVYYNLRLWVKQLDKEPDIEAISLDNIDTTSQWRVEIQEPEMEEAPEWLEEHADNLMEEGATEEEEEEVPLPVDTEAEEEIGLPVDPMPPPLPQRAIPRVGLGSVGTGRRQHTFPSTSSLSLTTSEGASGAVGSSTPTSSRVPPRPPTASRGKLVPFTRKRARAATTPRHRGNQ